MDQVTITAADLITVAGAGAAAFVVAQFAKMLFDLQARWVRTTAMLTGLVIVVIVTLSTGDGFDIVEAILAIIVGMQAGLSASALADTTKSGLDYQVTR